MKKSPLAEYLAQYHLPANPATVVTLISLFLIAAAIFGGLPAAGVDPQFLVALTAWIYSPTVILVSIALSTFISLSFLWLIIDLLRACANV